MDDDSSNSGHSSSINPPPSSNGNERSFRVRRPSSSLISSTTSPFPVPPSPNPLFRSSINRGSSFHHHQRDIDDDIQPQPSSPSPSSSSFTASSRHNRTGFSSSNSIANNNNSSFNNHYNRSSSPLGSPDSTFWGPSPSPGPVNSSNPFRRNGSSSSAISSNNNSQSIGGGDMVQNPPTPGGLCVVSSSTSVEDDIPASPFSPASIAEDNNTSEQPQSISSRDNNNPGNVAPSNALNNGVSVISGNSSSNNNHNDAQRRSPQINIPSSPNSSISSSILQNSITRRSGSSNNNNNSGPFSTIGSDNRGQYSSSSSSSNFSAPSSSYLSPLRNKIKKATSFEIFSAQAQASINNSNNSNSNNANSSKDIVSTKNPKSLLNSITMTNSASTSTAASTIAGESAVTVAAPGPSRLLWEYLPNNSSTTTTESFPTSVNTTNSIENINVSAATTASISNSLLTKPSHFSSNSTTQQQAGNITVNAENSNLEDTAPDIPLQFNSSKPFLIKKFAAKIAARLSKEQEQLFDASSTTTSAATSSSSFSVGSQFLSSSRNQIISPLLNNASKNSLLTETALSNNLSLNDPLNNIDGPLNLTDNSITSTAAASTSTTTSVVRNPIAKSFSKKIPMPPKQKILQRMQSGELFDGLSPPPPTISSVQSTSSLLPPSSSSTSLSVMPNNTSALSPPSARHSPPPSSSSSSLLASLQQQSQSQQSQLIQQEQLSIQQQLLHESLQQQQQQTSSLMESLSSLQQASSLDRYHSSSNYDTFVRNNTDPNSNDDFSNVQDVLSKSAIDCSTDPNIQVLYDDVADAYAYYYGNILTDEIFSNPTSAQQQQQQSSSSTLSNSSSRQVLMMPNNNSNGNSSNSLQDDMGNLFQSQQHGHLEFPLGIGNEDSLHQQQQHERLIASSREEVENLKQQLNEVAMDTSVNGTTQHVQYLDPNDPKLQNDSTLRNLLMMQPLRSHDDSWITSGNEYQSVRNLNTGGVGGLTNSILGNALLMNMVGNNNSGGSSNNNNASSSGNWVNDWTSRSMWQQQHQQLQHDQQTDDDSGGDQDEVMDMSVMDIEKSHGLSGSGSTIIVKHNGQHSQILDHNGAENLSLDDVDLVSDRELVAVANMHGIPLDLQLQQQQPLGLSTFSKSQSSLMQSQSDTLNTIESQGHLRNIHMDDEPVNLMATSNSDQDFAGSSQQHHSNSSRHSTTHQNLNDSTSSCIIASQDPNNSCVTILTTTSTTVATTAVPPSAAFGTGYDLMLNGGSLNDKRIIRYKKLKDSLMNTSEMSNLKHNNMNQSISINNNSATSSPGATLDSDWLIIPDNPVEAKAFASLPSPLNLVRGEDNYWRVYNRTKVIPCNTRFGPVEGPMKKVYEDDIANMASAVYPYLVLVDSSNILWHLDRTHDELCNWMKFIRLARSSEEQNALISEYNGYIYVTTCRDILPKVELRVGYNYEYAQKYSFRYLPPTPGEYINYTGAMTAEEEDEEAIDHNGDEILASTLAPAATAPTIQFPEKQQQQQQKSNLHNSRIVVSFPCFECDTEFGSVEELNKHLTSVHDNEDTDEEIRRRPKKKVLKKYYNSENINPNNANKKGNAAEDNKITSIMKHNNNSNLLEKKFKSPSMQVAAASGGRPELSSLSSSSISCQNCAICYQTQEELDNHTTNCNVVKEVIGSKYEKFPRKKAAMENALVQDSSPSTSTSAANSLSASSSVLVHNKDRNIKQSQLVASSIITTTANVASDQRKKNKCSLCYKNFATKDRLERHMIVHSADDTKPLQCPSCSKRFLTNSALAGHVKTHAEEGKCFECPMCAFSTQQLLQLKEHVQSHRRKDTGMFHCHRCPKKFSVYAMIRKHIRAFHGPKMFACDFPDCPMTFPSPDKLKLHKLKHSDHREFLCAECGRQFKRRDKLVEHTKRMHSENSKKKPEIIQPIISKKSKHRRDKKIMPKLSKEEFDKYTFKCAECMVGFKRRGMLVNHLAKRHPGKTPQEVPELNLPILKTTRNYFCLYCERVYKSSSKRKSHIMKSHPGKPLPPQLRGRHPGKGHEDTAININVVTKTEIKMDSLESKVVPCVSSDENGVSASGIQSKKLSLFKDAGKVIANPHACQWCHRQYATRAKLLQHQRKQHQQLMPPELQTPRTQKNNVQRNSLLKPEIITTISDSGKQQEQQSHSKIAKELQMEQAFAVVQQSLQAQKQGSSNTGAGAGTGQLTQDSSLSQVSGSDEVIGFFLTTGMSNGELASLLPELVVVPMTSLASNEIASITSTTNCSTSNNNNSNTINLASVSTTTVSNIPFMAVEASSSSLSISSSQNQQQKTAVAEIYQTQGVSSQSSNSNTNNSNNNQVISSNELPNVNGNVILTKATN